MEKQGTEWIEPGQGATVGALVDAVQDWERENGRDANSGVSYRVYRQGTRRRTNLRLTGHPLTAEDLKRISECK